MKLKPLTLFSLIATGCIINSPVRSDAVLEYELIHPNGVKTQHSISIRGRFLRLETRPRGNFDYAIMDTGRMLRFDVSNKDRNFQVTRLGKLYWPDKLFLHPRFKPLKKANAYADARCQEVAEIDTDGKTVAEHCMTTTGPLQLNAREMITLSRLFMIARRTGTEWPGVSTEDESQASIFSRTSNGIVQQLIGARNQPLSYDLFKVPDNYRRLQPDLPVNAPLPEQPKKVLRRATPKPTDPKDVYSPYGEN